MSTKPLSAAWFLEAIFGWICVFAIGFVIYCVSVEIAEYINTIELSREIIDNKPYCEAE